MRSKSCLLPFVISIQRIQSFGSIFLLQITLQRTNDSVNSLGTSITRRNVNLLKNPPAWPHINYSFYLPQISNYLFFTLVREASSKTRASFFIRGSKHLETIKVLRLRRRAFIRFSVFGTPDENLALVFDLLLEIL